LASSASAIENGLWQQHRRPEYFVADDQFLSIGKLQPMSVSSTSLEEQCSCDDMLLLALWRAHPPRHPGDPNQSTIHIYYRIIKVLWQSLIGP
jgi:hypothetical protein